jgi:aryl-alcohol dehydrogenase-like predicted oxidoreductase
VLHQGQDIVPIPGTRRPERIAESLASANVQPTAEQLAQIDAIAPRGTAVGGTLIG